MIDGVSGALSTREGVVRPRFWEDMLKFSVI
jgi:hypothetical protein